MNALRKWYIILLILALAMTGCSQNTSKASEAEKVKIYVGDGGDAYKLHIKNIETGEDKVLVSDPVIDACQADGWVYFLQMDKGISKIKYDGTEETNICKEDALPELSANTQVTSEYKNGGIEFKLLQLKEVGDTSDRNIDFYRLDIKTSKLTHVKHLEEKQ